MPETETVVYTPVCNCCYQESWYMEHSSKSHPPMKNGPRLPHYPHEHMRSFVLTSTPCTAKPLPHWILAQASSSKAFPCLTSYAMYPPLG